MNTTRRRKQKARRRAYRVHCDKFAAYLFQRYGTRHAEQRSPHFLLAKFNAQMRDEIAATADQFRLRTLNQIGHRAITEQRKAAR